MALSGTSALRSASPAATRCSAAGSSRPCGPTAAAQASPSADTSVVIAPPALKLDRSRSRSSAPAAVACRGPPTEAQPRHLPWLRRRRSSPSPTTTTSSATSPSGVVGWSEARGPESLVITEHCHVTAHATVQPPQPQALQQLPGDRPCLAPVCCTCCSSCHCCRCCASSSLVLPVHTRQLFRHAENCKQVREPRPPTLGQRQHHPHDARQRRVQHAVLQADDDQPPHQLRQAVRVGRGRLQHEGGGAADRLGGAGEPHVLLQRGLELRGGERLALLRRRFAERPPRTPPRRRRRLWRAARPAGR